MLFGLRFILWSLSNWSRLHDPQSDQIAALGETWQEVRWALLGIGIFAVGWIWALATSLSILSESTQSQPPVPPRLS